MFLQRAFCRGGSLAANRSKTQSQPPSASGTFLKRYWVYTATDFTAQLGGMQPSLVEQLVRECRESTESYSSPATTRVPVYSPAQRDAALSGGDVYNALLPPNSRRCQYTQPRMLGGVVLVPFGNQSVVTASSFHGRLVIAGVGDGSVRPIADSIDLKVWRQLNSVAGEDVLTF